MYENIFAIIIVKFDINLLKKVCSLVKEAQKECVDSLRSRLTVRLPRSVTQLSIA